MSFRGTCDICLTEFEYTSTYGVNECSKCGQQYCHDEGQQIVLTEKQLQLLRKQYQEAQVPTG